MVADEDQIFLAGRQQLKTFAVSNAPVPLTLPSPPAGERVG